MFLKNEESFFSGYSYGVLCYLHVFKLIVGGMYEMTSKNIRCVCVSSFGRFSSEHSVLRNCANFAMESQTWAQRPVLNPNAVWRFFPTGFHDEKNIYTSDNMRYRCIKRTSTWIETSNTNGKNLATFL